MHVTIVAGFDAAGASAGGTRTYAEGLATFLASERIPHLLVSGGTGGTTAVNRYEIPIRRRGSGLAFQCAVYPHVRSLPVPRDTIVHTQRPETLIPFALAHRGRARIVTLHGSPGRAIERRRGRLMGALYREVEWFALRGAHRVIAVDIGTSQEYTRRFPWLEGRLRVIPNGVDARSFYPMDQDGAKRRWGVEGTVLLYAGRLEPEKRVLDIVRAFQALGGNQTTLVIAGDGTQRPAIEAAARGLQVRLLGDVDRSEIPDLLNAAEAVVLFSEREGLPMIALEALACGTPVITTAVGGLAGLIRDGETGYFVSNARDLREAMRKVRDGKLHSPNSISMSVTSYDWREIGRRVLQVYEEVWDARPS